MNKKTISVLSALFFGVSGFFNYGNFFAQEKKPAARQATQDKPEKGYRFFIRSPDNEKELVKKIIKSGKADEETSKYLHDFSRLPRLEDILNLSGIFSLYDFVKCRNDLKGKCGLDGLINETAKKTLPVIQLDEDKVYQIGVQNRKPVALFIYNIDSFVKKHMAMICKEAAEKNPEVKFYHIDDITARILTFPLNQSSVSKTLNKINNDDVWLGKIIYLEKNPLGFSWHLYPKFDRVIDIQPTNHDLDKGFNIKDIKLTKQPGIYLFFPRDYRVKDWKDTGKNELVDYFTEVSFPLHKNFERVSEFLAKKWIPSHLGKIRAGKNKGDPTFLSASLDIILNNPGLVTLGVQEREGYIVYNINKLNLEKRENPKALKEKLESKINDPVMEAMKRYEGKLVAYVGKPFNFDLNEPGEKEGNIEYKASSNFIVIDSKTGRIGFTPGNKGIKVAIINIFNTDGKYLYGFPLNIEVK